MSSQGTIQYATFMPSSKGRGYYCDKLHNKCIMELIVDQPYWQEISDLKHLIIAMPHMPPGQCLCHTVSWPPPAFGNLVHPQSRDPHYRQSTSTCDSARRQSQLKPI